MVKKILVIKLGAFGDFIQALGPMAAIRRHHPDAEITLLTTKAFAGLAHQSNYFDHVWLDKRPKWYQPQLWISLRQKLNSQTFDRVYDLQNNDRTGFYFRLFSPKPEWVGIAKGASHRNISPQRTAGLAFDGHAHTLGLAGIDNVEVDDLSWMESELSSFNLPDKYILFVPGSAPQHPQKRWPGQYYGQLSLWFESKGYQTVLIGTKDDMDAAKTITATNPRVINLMGKTTLADIPALARKAKATIGNDTGPMHMIAPTGCPTYVIFSGKSNPVRHSPKGPHVHTMQENILSHLSVETVSKIIQEAELLI